MKRNLIMKIAAIALLLVMGGAIVVGASAADKYYPGPEPKPEEPVVLVTPKPEEPAPVITPEPQPPKRSQATATPEPARQPENYSLTVRYLYKDGSQAAVPYYNVYSPGENFNVYSPNISGYSRSRDTISGKMERRNESFVVYYYDGNTIVIDDYETPLGLGDVIINIGDCYE